MIDKNTDSLSVHHTNLQVNGPSGHDFILSSPIEPTLSSRSKSQVVQF